MRWIRPLQLWQSLTIGSDRLTYIGPDHPLHDAALFACLPAIFGEESYMAIPRRRAVPFGTVASLRIRWGSSPARVILLIAAPYPIRVVYGTPEEHRPRLVVCNGVLVVGRDTLEQTA